MNLTVRAATPADAVAACIVLRRSITECCVEDHRNEPEVLSVWLHNKTPEIIASLFATPENFSVVATSGEQITGVGLLTAKNEIALCYVLPEIRFTGVGKSLIRAMELHAVQTGLSKIHLSSTATAKSFYLRNGFMHSGDPEVEFGIQAFPLTKQLVANNGL
ncbi:MAG: GNAT family N-acetyltransferase [Gammaproteobacteria bacterium]|nr:GNAT family N-acetyltransferase [Gammaproteobacteria bacterium]